MINYVEGDDTTDTELRTNIEKMKDAKKKKDFRI